MDELENDNDERKVREAENSPSAYTINNIGDAIDASGRNRKLLIDIDFHVKLFFFHFQLDHFQHTMSRFAFNSWLLINFFSRS